MYLSTVVLSATSIPTTRDLVDGLDFCFFSTRYHHGLWKGKSILCKLSGVREQSLHQGSIHVEGKFETHLLQHIPTCGGNG